MNVCEVWSDSLSVCLAVFSGFDAPAECLGCSRRVGGL